MAALARPILVATISPEIEAVIVAYCDARKTGDIVLNVKEGQIFAYRLVEHGRVVPRPAPPTYRRDEAAVDFDRRNMRRMPDGGE